VPRRRYYQTRRSVLVELQIFNCGFGLAYAIVISSRLLAKISTRANYYFTDKGNCMLCYFVEVTYTDGSQAPASLEYLLHFVKYVIGSYVSKNVAY
jgi:hypothetical protein